MGDESEEDYSGNEDEQHGGGLVGFMFGNVDRNLQLDEDYMDEVFLEKSACPDEVFFAEEVHIVGLLLKGLIAYPL